MRTIEVRCPECSEVLDEKDIDILNCEEDFEGRDVVTFECGRCGETVKSNRRAK